eukprot:5987422-Pleurochrysis_carterae.AAC.4
MHILTCWDYIGAACVGAEEISIFSCPTAQHRCRSLAALPPVGVISNMRAFVLFALVAAANGAMLTLRDSICRLSILLWTIMAGLRLEIILMAMQEMHSSS